MILRKIYNKLATVFPGLNSLKSIILRDSIRINEYLIMFVPNSAGDRKGRADFALQAASQTFPFMVKVLEASGVPVKEPVDIWETVRDEDGKTILEKFYQDSKKYAFQFQVMALTTPAQASPSTLSRLHQPGSAPFPLESVAPTTTPRPRRALQSHSAAG